MVVVFQGDFRFLTLGFSLNFIVHSPLEAKLYAIREGVVISKDHMFGKIEIEIEIDIEALQFKALSDYVDDYSHHELGLVLRKVAKLLQQNWNVTISHIPKGKQLGGSSPTEVGSHDGTWLEVAFICSSYCC